METEVGLTKDYRNTTFSEVVFSLGNKKQILVSELKAEKPNIRNIYININTFGDIFNRKFKELYNYKCAYCGTSVQIIESSRFEIDHVIPYSARKLGMGYTSNFLNGIDNLVNSCQLCNRSKSSFLLQGTYLNLLHPDNEKLSELFYRDEDYSIKIKEEYVSDSFINDFYNKLKLHNEIRRIDYLLMEMKDFCEKYSSDELVTKLQLLISKIEQKKRFNY